MVGVGRVRRRTRDQFSQRRRGMCRNLRNLRTSSLCGAGTLGTLGSGASHVHAMGDAAASVAQVSVTRSLRSKTDDQLHMRCGWFVRTSVCSPQPDGVAKQKCTLLVLGGVHPRHHPARTPFKGLGISTEKQECVRLRALSELRELQCWLARLRAHGSGRYSQPQAELLQQLSRWRQCRPAHSWHTFDHSGSSACGLGGHIDVIGP